jgi:hypothetical protein
VRGSARDNFNRVRLKMNRKSGLKGDICQHNGAWKPNAPQNRVPGFWRNLEVESCRPQEVALRRRIKNENGRLKLVTQRNCCVRSRKRLAALYRRSRRAGNGRRLRAVRLHPLKSSGFSWRTVTTTTAPLSRFIRNSGTLATIALRCVGIVAEAINLANLVNLVPVNEFYGDFTIGCSRAYRRR